MPPESWLKSPSKWSTTQWDRVGYTIEALFGLYVLLTGGEIALLIMLLFSCFALLAWSVRSSNQ